MAKFEGVDGEMDIATLEERDYDGEEYMRVQTTGDLDKLVRAMGWDSLEQFYSEMDADESDVLGRWFFVCGNPSRLYTR